MKRSFFAVAFWVGLSLVGCGGPVDEGQEELTQVSESLVSEDCVPLTCEELGVECGRSRDNCGEFIHCGGCSKPSDLCINNSCFGPEEP